MLRSVKYNHKASIEGRKLTVYATVNSLEIQNVCPTPQLFLSRLMNTNSIISALNRLNNGLKSNTEWMSVVDHLSFH